MLTRHVILGTYNHLPEGLSEAEFESTYQTCYRPFLSALNRFPEIQAALYYSGSLLKRFEAMHPEYLMLLEEMSGRRQIELLGGGFYAPVLPLIPGSDRLGQIEMLTTYLRKSFGRRPRGCWLAEYAWEPWLASTLQTSGMDYTFLAQKQFKEALGRDDKDFIPVMTEDQGRCITVLPTFDCSTISASPVGFIEAAELSSASAFSTLMMPGEGIRSLWQDSGSESPDLYMERSFAWFRKNGLDLETTTPSRYLKTRRVASKLYFPGSAAGRFMSASAAPLTIPECGSMRRAILRYASSEALYSKMFYVHLLIGQLRGDKSRKKTAAEDLWKGQCGNAYWHSPDGGIDNPAIRMAAYQSLIDAELATRQKGAFVPGIIRADMDFDGSREYIYQGSDLNSYVHPIGAVIMEIDALKARRNLCDVFVDAPAGDKSRKSCFVDRIYAQKTQALNAIAPWEQDIGPFSSHPYEESTTDSDASSLSFYKDGILDIGTIKRSLTITKRFAFGKKAIKVSYGVRNRSDAEAAFWFGVELNFSLGSKPLESLSADETSMDASVLSALTGTSLGTISRLSLRLGGPVKSISLVSSVPSECHASIIGVDRQQGVAVLLSWPVMLAADSTWRSEITLGIHE